MDWHRLFGLFLTDFFAGSPFSVEMEKDLSLQQQFLDAVVLRKHKGRLRISLPDGLDNLSDHNLLTFKSHREALDDWALKELTGHYVNYRKQLAGTDQPLLPESAFRLYAVCSRYPHNLAQEVRLEPLGTGVYECHRGTDRIRVIVAGQLPRTENNALLHLLSASADQWRFGTAHYRQRSEKTSTLIYKLFEFYQAEGIAMPYTMEDFVREFAMDHFKDLTPAQRRKALKDLTLAERLEGLSAEQIEEYLDKLKGERKPTQPNKRRRK